MKVAVVQFPGSNCDQDALFALREDVKVQAEYVWYESTSLAGFDAVFLPGGFSYGDYLRCGAIAARAPIIEEIRRFADKGNSVIGVCNGFQVLCESRILAGSLLPNRDRKFLCQDIFVKAVNTKSEWTSSIGRVLQIPIAHGDGRFFADEETLQYLEEHDQIAFKYVNDVGEVTEEANVNGSANNIAGLLNERGNVLGLMPHPERATKKLFGSTDGLKILKAFLAARV